MSSYRQVFYQIVFSTKFREPSLNEEHEEQLYKYIWGLLKRKHCKLYRINGMPDHLHIFCDLHPCVCLADLVKDIKVASHLWIKETGLFPDFSEWQIGYAAFTYSVREKDMIINYIKKQKQHHQRENSTAEIRRLLEENKVSFDEKYLL